MSKETKLIKIAKISVVVCILIILIEGVLFFYLKHKQDANSIYYDAYQMVVPDGNDYVAVGSSDFKYSKDHDYTNGIERGRLVKLDSNGKIILDVLYDRGLSSNFSSVLVHDDFYYVTGSGVFDEYQQENKIGDAFLIKFDKNGNKIWEKYYGVLSNTKFNKMILVSDGIVVIGQSIYEAMEVGNHSTGGGVIVKYDFDGNKIWNNNHGGNKSGNFNDIIEVDGDFYVVGKDATDSGNLIKFDKNGEYKWHKNFSYTDSLGLQDLIYFNDKIYVVGSKKILEDEKAEDRKTENTDGVILVFDKKGNQKKEVTFGGAKLERFTDIASDEEFIYITGVSDSLDSSLEIVKQSEENLSYGYVLKYDKNLELVSSKVLGGENNDILTNMELIDNKFYVSMYSNSKEGTIAKDNNGKDYFGKVIEFNSNLELNIIK